MSIQVVWDSLGGTRIDWMTTAPDGSYCIMLKDGNVLSNRSDLLQSIYACRQSLPYAAVDHLEYVFWGPADSVLVKASNGALRWQGLPEAFVAELRSLTVGVDMLSAGFQLGKRTTLCPWDGGLYFLEFASFLGNTAKAYPYSLRQHGLSGDAMQYVVVNQRPPPHLLDSEHVKPHLPPPPPPPPQAVPPTPPASAPPEQEAPQSEDGQRIDTFVNTLAMPDDIRAAAIKLWDACTAHDSEPRYLTASQALQLFAVSQLSSEDIEMIWAKSDLDHNGLLDREEFVQAIYLLAVQQYLRGISDHRLCDQAPLGDTAAAQPTLPGTVKDIFKMFMDTGSHVSQVYMQSYHTSQAQYKEAQKQQELVREQLALQQQQAQQQLMLDALEAMQIGAQGSVASGMAKQLRDSLMSSIVTESPNVHWEDGKRKPRRAILLYGPPGTGKSYLAKAWFGESEGLVRELFDLAREKKPSVIFIDEIDALCNSRESGGGGGGRGGGGGGGDDATTQRLKTEFLVQMDGVGHGNNEGVVLLAATNLPWALDPAIRRRFKKRIHIPLPDAEARQQLFRVHGGEEWTGVFGPAGDVREKAAAAELAQRTEGFSGSDLANAVQDAMMLPVKRVRRSTHFKRDGWASDWWVPCGAGEAGATAMMWKDIPNGKARAPPLTIEDFFTAVAKVKPSVGGNEIQRCAEWTAQFGLEGA
ncbi:hypothetical protein SCUCBS95973_000584 [Sporothrix curviconia]|uniref:EF-hand domain-containing protein n=1 Tax=Sporothrix curviconia TaxID=1260050 RepID=A0ABP0ARF4_9PEZI